MLIPNKYKRIYDAICERGRQRTPVGYTEKHHVIPKSLGGSRRKDNLLRLTAREHYIAHLCLVRCTSGNDQRKMICAVHMFRYLLGKHITKFSAELFEANRKVMAKAVSESRRGFRHSEESKAKIRQAAVGRPGNRGFKHSDITKEKWSRARKGKPNPHAVEHFRRIGSRPKSEEWKAVMQDKMKGNRNPVGCTRSAAHKQAIAEANRRRWNDPEFVQRWNENKMKRKVGIR